MRADMVIWTSDVEVRSTTYGIASWRLIPSTDPEFANKSMDETITGSWEFTNNVTALGFIGDGSNLTNVDATHLNSITASMSPDPYSIAQRDPDGAIKAVSFIGDGSQLTGIDYSQVGGTPPAPDFSPYAQKAVDEVITGSWKFPNILAQGGGNVFVVRDYDNIDRMRLGATGQFTIDGGTSSTIMNLNNAGTGDFLATQNGGVVFPKGGGIEVAAAVTAGSFIGDGAQLTGIDFSQLNGTPPAPDFSPYQTITQSDLDDVATLASAASYTDTKFGQVTHPDLSGYETKTQSAADDAATLTLAKNYTDQIAIGGEISLDGYATIVKSEADDATILASANTYTDDEITGLTIGQYQTITQSDLDDVATLASAASYTDTKFGEVTHPDLSGYETKVQSVADDATTLASANTYTDGQITANAPNLAPYQTITQSDPLTLAKNYTDQIAIGGEISLDGYATIIKSEADDAATLTSANTYTDGQITANAPNLSPYQTITQSDLDDVATLASAASYTDTKFGQVTHPDLSGYETKAQSVADDVATLTSANTYTDGQITANAPNLSPYQTITQSDLDDAATLTSATSYTDTKFGQVTHPDLSGYETIIKSESDDATTLASATSYTDTKFGEVTHPDLSGYETKTQSAADDVATLTSANTYTDGQITANAPNLSPYQTITQSDFLNACQKLY